MTQQEILDALAEIVNEVTGIPIREIESGKSFSKDLDIDSLSMVEIATAAEDRFGVSIPDESLSQLKTVADAVTYIEKAGVPA